MGYLERRTGSVADSRTEARERPTPGAGPSVARAWTLFLPAATLVLCLDGLAQASGPLEDETVSDNQIVGLGDDGGVQPQTWNPVLDQVQAGAARVSIEPNPQAYNGQWEKENCDIDPGHLDNTRTFFPTNPDCIYIWGLGPNTPATGWNDDFGLWARSVAIRNGGQTVVMTMLDGFYWFGEYASFCDGCGGMQLAEELADEHGFDPAGFFLHATHSHAAPDFIGSGGGVPGWYMRQVTDAIRESVDQAIGNMRPAVLEAGEELVRDLNSERRDTYYSAEESGLSWFRAVALDRDEQPDPRDVIATVGAYAMHPVTKGDNDGTAHPDWPGLFVQRAEDRFGGLAFFFQTGLGQMSTTSSHIPEGDRFFVGRHLAERIPPAGEGQPITEPEIRTERRIWNHPATNLVSTSTTAAGLFDRQLAGPAAVQVGRHEQRQCTAASGVSVRTQVSAARIGSMVITGGPGELFANLTNTIKEHNAAGVTLPLSLINDGLGYIMQDFEAEQIYGQNVPGVAGEGPGEYEEVFGNECLGDAVLQYTLELFEEIE